MGWEDTKGMIGMKTTNKWEYYSLGPQERNLLETTSGEEQFACQGKLGHRAN